MKRAAAIAGLIAALAPRAAVPLTLEFPALATPLADTIAVRDSYFVPTEGYDDGAVGGITAEGAVRQRSWRINSGVLTTLQILAPLRAQIEADGYAPLFECEARACGGFDFRYEIDILPEPDMHVNLGDYRYYAAEKPGEGAPDYIVLVVSRSDNGGFVQVTQVGGSETLPLITTSANPEPEPPAPAPPVAETTGPVGEQLETLGHATLDDLTFKTGSAELGDETFASLERLAAYLKDRPGRRVTLVGHTDSEGPLDRNLDLSKRRARAVADRLIDVHGVDPVQVASDGVGFLSPRATNLTPEGRARNRRVEVILTSTE